MCCCSGLCPVGNYAPTAGLSACVQCSKGTVALTRGLAGCSACPALSEASDNGATCTCSKGTYLATDLTCKTCPDGFSCTEKGQEQRSLQVKAGWYRSSSTSLDAFECSNDACLGGNSTQQCKPYHTGFLCAQCEAGSSIWGSSCTPCNSGESTNWILLAIVISFVYVIALHRMSQSVSGLPKILMFFAQVAILIVGKTVAVRYHCHLPKYHVPALLTLIPFVNAAGSRS